MDPDEKLFCVVKNPGRCLCLFHSFAQASSVGLHSQVEDALALKDESISGILAQVALQQGDLSAILSGAAQCDISDQTCTASMREAVEATFGSGWTAGTLINHLGNVVNVCTDEKTWPRTPLFLVILCHIKKLRCQVVLLNRRRLFLDEVFCTEGEKIFLVNHDNQHFEWVAPFEQWEILVRRGLGARAGAATSLTAE